MGEPKAEFVFFSMYSCGGCKAFKGVEGNSEWDKIVYDKELRELGIEPMIYEFGVTQENGEQVNYQLEDVYRSLFERVPHLLLRVPGTQTQGVSYNGTRNYQAMKKWLVEEMENNMLFGGRSQQNTTRSQQNTTRSEGKQTQTYNDARTRMLQNKQKKIQDLRNKRETYISKGYDQRRAGSMACSDLFGEGCKKTTNKRTQVRQPNKTNTRSVNTRSQQKVQVVEKTSNNNTRVIGETLNNISKKNETKPVKTETQNTINTGKGGSRKGKVISI